MAGNALDISKGGTSQTTAAGARIALGLEIGSDVQAWDADLDAIAALGTTGIIVRTGSGTAATRTITGTANEITVTNGSGVSGNPTISIPSAVTFTGKTITGGTYANIAAIYAAIGQTAAQFQNRTVTGNFGNQYEFGHSNTAGYGSAIGANVGGGQPWIVFSGEGGTTSNTFRTRGFRSTIIKGDLAGGLTIENVPTAAATDNQVPVVQFTFSAAGVLTANTGSFSGPHNGTVGATTPAAGSFTTLTASSTVTFNQSNASISMAPTGTGTVTINPATAGTANNISIGATTRSTGAFTTLAANSTVTFTNGGSMTGTWSDLGSVTTIDINGGTVDNTTIGATTRSTLAATTGNFNSTLTANAGGSLTGTWTSLGTVTTIDINGGTVDGTVIGGATPAAGTFTTLAYSTGAITSGTWTPTGTAGTNCAAVTPTLSYYFRVGDSVTCWGLVTSDPTAGAAATVFDLSLPIASALANSGELAGVASSSVENGRILANTTNDRAQCTYVSAGTAATNFSFHFSYRII